MVGKETAVKKYVVRLSAEEHAQLDELTRKEGKRSAQLLTRRAAVLLAKADVSELGEGWSDSRIAAALDTSIATIERTRRQLVEEGFEAVLRRKYNPNSARPRIFDGVAEAKLVALTLSPAREGFARGSVRLFEEKVVELHIVERASDNTIGRTLKKNILKPHRKQQWVIPPDSQRRPSSPPWKTCWRSMAPISEYLLHGGHDEARGQAEHEDADSRFEWADEPPCRQRQDISVSNRRITLQREIQSCLKIRQHADDDKGDSPDSHFKKVQEQQAAHEANQCPYRARLVCRIDTLQP